MHLGAFSVSLAVRDLKASVAFYEHLGFTVSGGDADQGWLVLRMGTTTLGLFQGMFDSNLMTFNPGWAQDTTPLSDFTDVRDVQAHLRAAGVEPVVSTDPDGTSPGHIMVVDPDGNQILIDQHVPRPGG